VSSHYATVPKNSVKVDALNLVAAVVVFTALAVAMAIVIAALLAIIAVDLAVVTLLVVIVFFLLAARGQTGVSEHERVY
jgi:uncharacterized membrane protein